MRAFQVTKSQEGPRVEGSCGPPWHRECFRAEGWGHGFEVSEAPPYAKRAAPTDEIASAGGAAPPLRASWTCWCDPCSS